MSKQEEGFSKERIKALQNWDNRNTLLQEIVSSTEDLNIPSIIPIRIRVLRVLKRNFPQKTKKSIKTIQEIIDNLDGISQATPGAEKRINLIKQVLDEYIEGKKQDKEIIHIDDER